MNLPQASTRGVHRTAIEWADYAVGSPFRFRDRETGEVFANACVKVSSGCAHCYAETIGQRFGNARPYTQANMDRLECVIDDSVIRSVLTFRPKPEKGEATYKNNRPRPLLFLGDMTDVFGEWVPDHLLDQVIAAVALRPDVDVIVLTKRAARMREYFVACSTTRTVRACNEDGSDHVKFPAPLAYANIFIAGEDEVEHDNWPLPNLWLGVSVEDQATADERIPHLLATPAAVRVVSAEPLVGPVDLLRVDAAGFGGPSGHKVDCIRKGYWSKEWGFTNHSDMHAEFGPLHWVICGGESGPGARPCNVEWIRSLVRQGKEAGVATFVKQLGSRVLTKTAWWPASQLAGYDASSQLFVARLRDRKGGDPSEWPEDLRVRQMPGGAA